MPRQTEPDTDELLARVATGEQAARDQLLARHQERLRQLVSLRMDKRLQARFDPSDVIQETLVRAARRLEEYVQERPLPFYPWLREIALERLIDLRRRHLVAQRRSVRREEVDLAGLPEDSMLELVQRLYAHESSPSARLRRSEKRQLVHGALLQLGESDRELLVLRHLEQLSGKEIAAILGISEGTVNVRHLRALRRLRELLDDPNQT